MTGSLIDLRNWRWILATATCKRCRQPYEAGHICKGVWS